MKIVVDNFAVLGAEFCLLEQFTTLFTPEVVTQLEDSLIRDIAAEREESVQERVGTMEKLQVLEDGLAVLNRYRRQRIEDLLVDDQKGMDEVGVSEIDDDAAIQANDSPEEVAQTNVEEACIEVEPVGYAVSAGQERSNLKATP
ncbi:hypothetical protein LTR49_028673 [Elasticomyces elasticus]|nr:hypothetical protein LTR49_028673 [Elasticomyces elasticus]